MMKLLSTTLSLCLYLVAMLVSPGSLAAAEQTPEIVLSVDYIEPDREIAVSSAGGTATLHIISYGGIPEETLLGNINNTLAELSINWVTNVYLTNKEGQYEADLNFDLSSNDSDHTRELIVSATNGSSRIIQEMVSPNIYTLLPNVTEMYLLHGGENALILSSSDSFASYRLLKDSLDYTITVADVQGKSEGNRQLKFIIDSPGTYYCIAYYPVEVQMNGTRRVSWHYFYDTPRSCSLSPNPYSLSKDGGSISFTYNVSAEQDSLLQRITEFYNSGNCTIWDTTMNISYTRLSSSQVRMTVESGPNLRRAQVYPPLPNTITNNTYFKNSSGEEIAFTQPAGGRINAYNVSSPEDADSVPPYLILEGTQPRVHYALLKDGQQWGPSRRGHGDTLHLSIPADSGKFTVMATYGGERVAMKGTLTITGEMKAVWGENWILKETFTAENGASSTLDITYYDGLGYPSQIISVGASPTGKNIITPIWYDPMRREDAKAYLPYTSATSSRALLESEPLERQKAFYSSLYGSAEAAYAFTERVYEASPLNRVLREFTPGESFRATGTGSGGNDHYTAFSYQANEANDVLDISCNENGALMVNGYLAAGKLFKRRVTSPDGREATEFKDSDGRLFLQSSGTGENLQETYYVYDSRMRLRWVIQPEGSCRIKNLAANASSVMPYTLSQEDSIAKEFCFIYSYDGLGRMTEKRIPGKGLVYLVYDPAGRLVARQDSMLRGQNNNWLLMRYDSLSRVTSTYISVQRTREQMVSAFAAAPYPEIYGESGNTLLSRAEYGTTAQSSLAFTQVTGVVTTADKESRTKGLLTYDKTLDLTTQSLAQNQRRYRERAYYYDTKGRVIQTVEKEPEGEILRTSFKYDFIGNPLTTVHSLEKGTNTHIEQNTGINQDGSNTLTQLFTYDNRGRKLTSASYLNNISNTYSAVNYEYDALGRLINASYGRTTVQGSAALAPSTTTPVLSHSLSYNIQGWMTSQTDLLKKGTAESTHHNIYSQALRYHDAAKTSTTKSYDGLITEWEATQYSNGTDFTAAGTTQSKTTYAFSYDAFGRLTQSTRFASEATTSDNAFTERNLSYDKNGNLLSLTRYGNTEIKDNFYYSYSGNRLKRLDGTFNGAAITHAAQTGTTQASGTADYLYDGNGNMTYDALRHLALTYNLNNLVNTVSRNDTLLSTYTYLADGTKYKIIDAAGNGRSYIGPFCLAIEKSGSGSSAETKAYLESIEKDGGRILAIEEETGSGTNSQRSTSYTTLFFIRDHLGSIRAVTDAQGHILERNAYYPFGLQTNQNQAFPTITTSLATLYPNSISSLPARRDLYNGKEIQTAAGTDYLDYGFRQYDPTAARWFNIDPMAEKYYIASPFSYCINTPILLIDREGNDIYLAGKNGSTVIIKTKLIDIVANVSFLDIDWGGNYTFEGDEILSAALDIIGIADPVGIADGVNAFIQAKNGDWIGSAISILGVIPFVGDVAKVGKVEKDIQVVEKAIDAVRETQKAVHGNSKASQKAQHLYEIYVQESGFVAKTGISGGKVSKAGKSYRATNQVNRFNKNAGYQKYDSRIIKTEPAGPEARATILKAEKENADRLKKIKQLNHSIHKRP